MAGGGELGLVFTTAHGAQAYGGGGGGGRRGLLPGRRRRRGGARRAPCSRSPRRRRRPRRRWQPGRRAASWGCTAGRPCRSGASAVQRGRRRRAAEIAAARSPAALHQRVRAAGPSRSRWGRSRRTPTPHRAAGGRGGGGGGAAGVAASGGSRPARQGVLVLLGAASWSCGAAGTCSPGYSS